MRIASAAMSFISIPSPKDDPFNGGPTKDKKKSRSFTKVLSAPIRRMSRHLSRPMSRKSRRKSIAEKTSKILRRRDEDEGWIAPANTFETEDTLSPRSLDSLTPSDSTLWLAQSGDVEEEEIVFSDSILDSSKNYIDDDEYLDLEIGMSESAETSIIFRMGNDVQDDTHDIEYNENITEKSDGKYAAPRTSIKEVKETKNINENEEMSFVNTFREHISLFEERSLESQQEDQRDSMISLLSRIDTSEMIDETNEIDSLTPAADISFFFDEEEADDFQCVGRLTTRDDEVPPAEIDVDSVDNLSKTSQRDEKKQELYIDDEELSTGSYNSYLQVIESITASVDNTVRRSMTLSMDKIDIEMQDFIEMELDIESESSTVVEEESQIESEQEEDCYLVSFNPSRELLLQAMEGASAKAKADIEHATALALSKMNSMNSTTPKRKKLDKSPNRVLGVLFFFLFLVSIKDYLLLHSPSIDKFQMNAFNDYFMEPYSSYELWGDKQMIERTNKTQVALQSESFFNVGCVKTIGCLALGNI